MIGKVRRIEIVFDENVDDKERANIAMAIAMILHTNIYYYTKNGSKIGVRYNFYSDLKQRIGELLNNIINNKKKEVK